MLSKIYAKYSGLIIKIIGAWFFILGVLELMNVWLFHAPNLIYYPISAIIFVTYIIGGILFIQQRKQISWSIINANLTFMVLYKIRMVFYSLNFVINDDDNSLGLICVDYFDPMEELKSALFQISIYLIVMSILHNTVFIERYKVESKFIYISLLAGALIFCLRMISFHL